MQASILFFGCCYMFICLCSLQVPYQMDWARQWTIAIRLNESAFAIMEQPAESTLWQGFMVLLMVHQNIFILKAQYSGTLLYHDLSTHIKLTQLAVSHSMLCVGIIGGLTSVITSTVEGVKTEGGVSGFFSGLGKGLVGTVTKPVAGALDFASETAQTVRDMASLSNRYFFLNYVFRLFVLLWRRMTEIFI